MTTEIFFDGSRYISAKDAAQAAGVTRDYIGRLCRDGKVLGKRVGKLWYIKENSLNDFLVNKSHDNQKRREELSVQRASEYKAASNGNRASKGISIPTAKIGATSEKSQSTPFAKKSVNSSAAKTATRVNSEKDNFAPTPERTEAVKEMIARGVNVMNNTARHASLQAATVATHKVPVNEVADVGQRVAALFLAFMLVFGTYGFVDAQYANFAKESARKAVVYTRSAPGKIAKAVNVSNLNNSFKQFKQVATAASAAANNPAAAASSFGVGVSDSFFNIAKRVNQYVDDFVYEIVFTPEIRLAIDSISNTQNDGLVQVTIVPTSSQNKIVRNQNGPTTIVQQPVIERVLTTERVVTQGGVSESTLVFRLNELENKLTSQIYNVSASIPPFSGPAESTATTFHAFALSNNIDQLTNTTINTPTITTPTITGGTISGATITGGSVTATSFSGTLGIGSGGTGTSTEPSYGQLLLGQSDGSYNLVATSSLGISGGSGSGDSFAWTVTGYGVSTSTIVGFTNGFLSSASSTISALNVINSTTTNATTTNLYVSGQTTLATSLTGPLQAIAGVVSATSTLSQVFGGTGLTSYTTGDILYANASGVLTKLAKGADGEVLKLSSGLPDWGSDISGGGGGTGLWATSTAADLLIRPADTNDVVVIGSTATTSTGNIFEVVGSSLFDAGIFSGTLTAYDTITAPSFTATSTEAVSSLQQLLVNSSTTLQNFTATNSTTTNATTTNIFATTASSTNLFTSNLSIANLSGFLKATAGSIATSLIDLASDITGILGVSNGGTGQAAIVANTLLLGNGTSALATTTAGTDGQTLALVSGVPTWVSTTTLSTISGTLAISSGGTGATSFTTGEPLAYDGSTLVSTSTLSDFVISDALTISSSGSIDKGALQNSGTLSFDWVDSEVADDLTIDSTNVVTAPNFVADDGAATSTLAGGLAVETSGLVYDFSTNNVGIGTAAPDTLLSLGNSLGLKVAVYENGSTKYGFGIQSSLFEFITPGSADYTFGYGTSGSLTRLFTIKGSGNVGIGLTSPGTKLDVLGTASSTNLFVNTTATTTNLTITGITDGLLSTNGLGQVVATSTIGVNLIPDNFLRNDANDTTTEELTAANLVTTNAAATTTLVGGLAVETSGLVYDFSSNRVGIGTAAPTTGLDIDVNTDISGDVTISGGSSLTFSATGPINQSGTGQVTFAGNVNATNGLDVTNANLTVGGSNFSVAQATGNTVVGGTLDITGAIQASSTLQADGASRFYSTLQADGALTAAGAGTGLSVTNNATVGGTLTVTGAATLSSTLDVTGAFSAGATTLSGALALGANKITGVGDPAADQDAATKAYVDSVAQGLDLKASVRVGTTANITLSGEQTIDGVALSAGDRVLVKDQTDATKNGIYVVGAGSWSRSTDADADAEVNSGMFTFVEEGTINADSGWVLTTSDPITVGTTELSFTQFSGAGQIIAGTGLTKSANTFNVIGTTDRITANADSIDIASTYVGQTSLTTVGALSSGSISSGFGAINIGTSALTAGEATFSAIVGSAITGSGNLTINGTGSFTGDLDVTGELSAATTTLSGNLVMSSKKITGLADPTSAQEAATKAYVDAIAQGLSVKASVRVGTTTNITLSGTQTIDGVSAIAGNRVLVMGQSTASENGIYVVAAGAWSRSTDADENSEVTQGLFSFIEEGTENANTGWVITTADPITVDSTSISFTQFSASSDITAGDGLTKTGSTLDIGGTADRITISADSVDIASTYVGQSSLTTVGALASGSISSGFGAIDIGSSALTGGTGTFTSLVDYGTLTIGGTATTTIQGDSATSTFSGGITLAAGNYNAPSGGSFLINDASVLNSTTLGSSVLSSSLTSVGGLSSGSITTGFGAINIGADTLDAGTTTTTNLVVSNTSESTFAGALAVSGQTTLATSLTGPLQAIAGVVSASSTLSDFYVSDALTISSSGSIDKGALQNSGTLSFDWVDAEIADALTISGGTIGANNISGTQTTTGTLTFGDGGDRIDISSDTWDVINGAISGVTTFTASGLGTFGNILATASSTLQGFTFTNATGTNATTTNFAISSLANALLATDANGTVISTSTIGANLIPDNFLRNDGDDTTTGVITSTGFTIGSAAITEAELEILDGATLTTTELNYVDGVTSAIQAQLDAKGNGDFAWTTTGPGNATTSAIVIGTTTAPSLTTLLVTSTSTDTTTIFDVQDSTSISALSVSATGFGTTTVTGLTISGSATSTSNVGHDITTGCYAVNGTCVGGGGGSSLFTDGGATTYLTSTTDLLAVGTATAYSKLTVWNDSDGNIFEAVNSASTTLFSIFADSLGGVVFNTARATTTIPNNTAYAWTIATSTTGSPLFRVDTTSGSEALTFGESLGAGDAVLQFGGDSNAWSAGYLSTDKSFVIASSTDLSTNAAFTINKGGNVGIGTTSPQTKLEVVNTSSGATADQLYLSNLASATSTASRLTFRTDDVTNVGTSTGAITSILTQNFNTGLGELTFSTLQSGTLTEAMRIDSSGNVGIGTTSPYANLSVWGGTTGNIFEAVTNASSSALTVSATGLGTTTLTGLNINGSATSTSNVGFNITTGCFAVSGTCVGGGGSSLFTDGGATSYLTSTTDLLAVGTATAYSKLTVWGDASGTVFEVVSSASTTLASINSDGTAYFLGNLGIGTTTPSKKLSVTDTVSDSQFSIAYDGTRYANFQVNSVGDLIIDPQGDDVFLNADNFFVCTGGSCPSGNPAGTGSLIVESTIGIATTTSTYMLSIEGQDATTNLLQVASTTNQSILVVNSAGNVGIGTSSPFSKFAIGAGGAIVTTEKELTDAATIAVSWLDGNQQKVVLGGNRTINFSNYTDGQILRLVVCQDSTGSRTVTWGDTALLWNGGTAPTLTTTADKCDVMSFVATQATSTLSVFGAATLDF